MKRPGLVAIIALAMSFPVGAAEQQPEQSIGSQEQTYAASLGVVMGLIQVSHFKLWLAGNLRNWPLAEYQLSQMRAALHDCRVLFPNVAAADTSAISRSAEEFRDAIRTKDGVKFDAAFQKFTAECNNCHKGAGLGFIKIKGASDGNNNYLTPNQRVVCARSSPFFASSTITLTALHPRSSPGNPGSYVISRWVQHTVCCSA